MFFVFTQADFEELQTRHTALQATRLLEKAELAAKVFYVLSDRMSPMYCATWYT